MRSKSLVDRTKAADGGAGAGVEARAAAESAGGFKSMPAAAMSSCTEHDCLLLALDTVGLARPPPVES